MVIHGMRLSPLGAADNVFRIATLEGRLPRSTAIRCGLWCRTSIEEEGGTTFMAPAIFSGGPNSCGVFPTLLILASGSRSPTSAC